MQKKSVYETSSRLLETLNDNDVLDKYEQEVSKFIDGTLRMHSMSSTINTKNTFVGVSEADLESMTSYLTNLEPVEKMIAELKIIDLEFKLIWRIIYHFEPKEVTFNKIQSLRKELRFHPLEIVKKDFDNA